MNTIAEVITEIEALAGEHDQTTRCQLIKLLRFIDCDIGGEGYEPLTDTEWFRRKVLAYALRKAVAS